MLQSTLRVAVSDQVRRACRASVAKNPTSQSHGVIVCAEVVGPGKMNKLMTDLVDIKAFIVSQQKAHQDVTMILASQFKIFMDRIDLLEDSVGPVDVREATRLTDIITEGPWGKDEQAAMARRINDWTVAKPRDTEKKGTSLQQCLHFENYLDGNEVQAIDVRSKAYNPLRAARIELVVNKASLCGISCPSKPTSGRLTALIQ